LSNQWPNLESSYLTNNVGVQYDFNKGLKGIGVGVLNDVSGPILRSSLSLPVAFGP